MVEVPPRCPLCGLDGDRAHEVIVRRDPNSDCPGHTWVLPRDHVASYFDTPPRVRELLWDAVARVEAELSAEFETEGCRVRFETGPHVAHLQIHVIPRHASGSNRSARVVEGGRADPLAAQLLPVLDHAQYVDLALGFVFMSGVAALGDRLVDVLRRPDARVRILTGDYQDVTDPVALRRLLRLPDKLGIHPSARFELKIYEVHGSGDSFHPKAWILGHGGRATAWIGSSNLSRRALETGLEWSYQVVDPDALTRVQASFAALWEHEHTRTVDDAWIDAYAQRRVVTSLGPGRPLLSLAADEPTPAPARPLPGIQTQALLKLEQTRAAGNRSGLVVLATGLGKTFLSAFDSLGFARVLFVAHREEILRQALDSYQQVRPSDRLGLYCGAEKDAEAAVLFASVQTLSAPELLERWDPGHFDYIVIDEFHHAAAPSYRRILDHFAPKFLLGLTATPDRLDGLNLLTLTDGNLVYTADIVRGINEGQLAPFHYFGIGDDTVYERIPWRDYTDERLTSAVSTIARARHAFTALREHTVGRVRALGFCVTQRHAQFMAEQFRALGVECAAVYVGSADPRVESLARLERGELEVVFCVDMFNEGLDLPSLDTILLLRPTQSPVVFTQQLGRGLRFVAGKTLTVLDLIGNHEVFSRRPELLLDVLASPDQAKRTADALTALVCADIGLPRGVELAWDLEARDILARLREQTGRRQSKPVRWFFEFRERHDRRPTALEADHAGWLEQLRKRAGSWFAFVASNHAFDDPREAEAFAEHSSLLDGVEALAIDDGRMISTLEVLLEAAPAGARLSKLDIVEGVRTRARRSAAAMRDLAGTADEPAAVLALLEREVFSNLATLGQPPAFVVTAKHVTSPALRSEAVVELLRELVALLRVRFMARAHKSAMGLPTMVGRNGESVDARFDVEIVDGQTTVVFHSAGDGSKRNNDYRRGLELLLRRLVNFASPPLVLDRVEVDTAETRKHLSPDQRSVQPKGYPVPLLLVPSTDEVVLARAISSAAKLIKVDPKKTRGGNDRKRLRFTLAQPVPPGELWRALQGRRG